MESRSKSQKRGNYDVGYGRPPKVHQWTKGQSGNPKGRAPEPSLDSLEYLARALKRKIVIKADGKTIRVSAAELLMQQLVADAIKGNASARRELFKMLNFVEAVDQRDVVITARLVLEEEDRFKDANPSETPLEIRSQRF